MGDDFEINMRAFVETVAKAGVSMSELDETARAASKSLSACGTCEGVGKVAREDDQYWSPCRDCRGTGERWDAQWVPEDLDAMAQEAKDTRQAKPQERHRPIRLKRLRDR